MKAQVETITPERARQYLDSMIHNRTLNHAKTIEFAIAIDERRWSINGESLKFDKDGHLFDGQHRLQACLLAGRSFESLVVRGVDDPTASATVDVGVPRTPGHVFQFADVPNANVIAGAARLVYFYENKLLACPHPRTRMPEKMRSLMAKTKGAGHNVKITTPDKMELLAFALERMEMLQAGLRGSERAHVGKVLTPSLACACFTIFAARSEKDAQQFFNDLGSGAELANTDPVLVLREKMLYRNTNHARFSTMAMMLLTFKAWNKRRKNEHSKILKIVEGEEFPKVL